MMQAIAVSVINGRCVPCCSKLPTGSAATSAARSRTSGDVAVVNRSMADSWLDGLREYLPQVHHIWTGPVGVELRSQPTQRTLRAGGLGRREARYGLMSDLACCLWLTRLHVRVRQSCQA